MVVIGSWSLIGPEASGSNVLIVIEDASPKLTGVFPGTVCFQVTRDQDSAVITEGCLKFAASIAVPDGFDRSVLYTLSVTVNAPGCVALDDERNGSGFTPFKVRVFCLGDAEERSGEANAIFGAASASPIAIPVRTAP